MFPVGLSFFFLKKGATCNLECAIVTSIALQFQYSLCITQSTCNTDLLVSNPSLQNFPCKLRGIFSAQCSSHLIVYPQYSLSADMKLTSTVLQPDHTDVLPALTAPEHLKTTFHDYQASRTGCLYLEGMRHRTRKVSFSLSSLSATPKLTYVWLLHHHMIHTQRHLDIRWGA